VTVGKACFCGYLRIPECGHVDVKEATAVILRSADIADKEKRSCFHLIDVDSWGLFLQRAGYERYCKSGSLLRIPQQTIILHARHTTRERHLGFFKAVFSNSGSHLLPSYGYMATVCSFFSSILYISLTPIFVAGSGKSVLWFVISCYYSIACILIVSQL
jgi:hypothetical protein